MLNLSQPTVEEIRAIAAERGCRLLAVESGGAGTRSLLRLVLERVDGGPATLSECEEVSREVSLLLDASGEIAHHYTLEVSSAGLDRKLYCLEDALRFVGRRVRVRTETPVMPEATGPSRAPALPARNFQGTLSRVSGDLLTVVDEENGKTYNVCFGNIRLARLMFEWPDRGRRVVSR